MISLYREMTMDAYVLSGGTLERLFKMTDFSREDSIRRFSRQFVVWVLMKSFVNVVLKMGILYDY